MRRHNLDKFDRFIEAVANFSFVNLLLILSFNTVLKQNRKTEEKSVTVGFLLSL